MKAPPVHENHGAPRLVRWRHFNAGKLNPLGIQANDLAIKNIGFNLCDQPGLALTVRRIARRRKKPDQRA